MEWRKAGWSVCLPLLIFPCTIKFRSSLPTPAHPGGPGKRAVKWLWYWPMISSVMPLNQPPMYVNTHNTSANYTQTHNRLATYTHRISQQKLDHWRLLRFAFSALTLLVGQQEGHPARKKNGEGGWWRWALVSPDGVALSRMVSVSASVNLPLHHKVQKFNSGTGSPGWSQRKGRKMALVWWWWDFCTMHKTAKFPHRMFNRSEVIMLTNKQMLLKTSTSLRYATLVGKNLTPPHLKNVPILLKCCTRARLGWQHFN